MNRKQYIEKHRKELELKKKKLEEQIEQAYSHYADDLYVHRLKTKKLRIKDELEELKSISTG